MQSFLKRFFSGPPKEIHNLNGRVALVLGGALGIGYEISRAFALNGARVTMVNRQEDQGKAAIENIKQEGGDNTPIEWFGCDLANLEEVKQAFTTFYEREGRLDLLVLCAGINANQYSETKDGIDRHFQVNWLSQFYICNLLFPLMRKTSKMPDVPPPRIVWETSEVHRAAPTKTQFISIKEINNPDIGVAELYARSKLAIILGVKYGFVDRVIKPREDDILDLAVHPGTVTTAMQQQWKEAYPGLLGKLITTTMTTIGRNPEQGSFSALYAASSPEIEKRGWNGYYFTDPGHPGKESKQARNPQLGENLWDLSNRLIKEKLGEDAMADWGATKQ